MRHSKYHTAEEIAEMRARGYDFTYLAKLEACPRNGLRNDLIDRIRSAFQGVTLGNGVGLMEGQALDDYEDAETCAAIRAKDEKEDWSKLDAELLHQCQSSLSFFDAEGMRFHLPAFLIQGLLEEIDPPIFALTRNSLLERFTLFSPEQRAIVRDYLRFMVDDPDESYHKQDLLIAIAGYWAD